MNLSVFLLKVLAFFQSLICFVCYGVWWTEITYPADATVIPGPENPAELCLDDFSLIWADDFDGASIDGSKWTGYKCQDEKSVTRMGCWWNTDLAIVHDGKIHIQTKYFENGYKSGKNGWYSCGLCTDGLFDQTYGYFEIRCILPKGTGIWPSFWMMPHQMNDTIGNGGIDGAEIDVFEAANYQYRLSNNVNVVSSAIHYDACGSDQQKQTVCTPFLTDNDPYEEYNTYGVEWNEKEYIFNINGKETGRTDFGSPSRVPEYMIINVNVSGTNGFPLNDWAGNALTYDSVAPTDFIIDYVRVYQYHSLLK